MRQTGTAVFLTAAGDLEGTHHPQMAPTVQGPLFRPQGPSRCPPRPGLCQRIRQRQHDPDRLAHDDCGNAQRGQVFVAQRA